MRSALEWRGVAVPDVPFIVCVCHHNCACMCFTTCPQTYGMTFSFVDLTVDGELERAITPQSKMVWLESPTNPTLKICDIAKIAEVCKRNSLLLVVDNTFMTCYFQVPCRVMKPPLALQSCGELVACCCLFLLLLLLQRSANRCC